MLLACISFICELKGERHTCKIVSLISIPPEETFLTNSFFSSSSFVKRYEASGFDLEFITAKQSSKLSTYSKPEEGLKRIIATMHDRETKINKIKDAKNSLGKYKGGANSTKIKKCTVDNENIYILLKS